MRLCNTYCNTLQCYCNRILWIPPLMVSNKVKDMAHCYNNDIYVRLDSNDSNDSNIGNEALVK